MSKRHVLIDPAQPTTSKQSKLHCPTNWELCALCQVETREALQCPARSSKPPVGSCYVSLARDLLAFREIEQIPAELDLNRLDDGNGIEATLMTNRAQWHRSCRLRYSQMKRQRRRKSLEEVEQCDVTKIHTRSAHSHVCTKEPVCFFCNKPAGSDVLRMLYNKTRQAGSKDGHE